jgi:RNA polymerase sigma-70 factor (ECF subfamily)
VLIEMAEQASESVEIVWLRAAQAGGEAAFARLTEPYRGELHRHCYRMTGSLDDADDALQETLVRAWRHLGSFEPRAPFRAWLYRIATNVCLTVLAKRTRQGEIAPSARRWSVTPEEAIAHLDPYPDRLLDEGTTGEVGPEVIVEERETIELAFVAAVQVLAPRQRAVLLLRDVLDWTAREVADLLGVSVAAVNSLLHRARSTLERERDGGRVTRNHAPAGNEIERRLARDFMHAWVAADIDGLVALLTADALFTMPPEPARCVGRQEISAFLAAGPFAAGRYQFRLVATRANRQPALAAYLADDATGLYREHAIILLAIAGSAISAITRLTGSGLFARFDLPAVLSHDAITPINQALLLGSIPDHVVAPERFRDR